MNTIIYILAGGSGTRLAPLSLTMPGKLPKQFLALIGEKTMLQETYERVPKKNQIVIVPEEKYTKTVQKQLGEKTEILAEPFGCNTAAAIALSAKHALEITNDPETILFFTPADHIMDKKAFQKYFKTAVDLAQNTDAIVTFGIKPTRAETGYGYIQTADALDKGVFQVSQFVEKPDGETAKQYLAAGNYYWNAGIFCMKIKTILQSLEKDAPLIYQHVNNINLKAENLSQEIAQEYEHIKHHNKNISIDYAVMEKEAENILLVEVGKDLEWNDVGGWVALAKYVKPEKNNNLVLNYLDTKVELTNCNDLVVVTSDNGILITKQELAARAKELIPGIEEKELCEMIECQNVHVKNNSSIYLGVIGLNGIEITFDGKSLKITQE